MQRWRGLDGAPPGWGRSVTTIGVFDGVHRGHQQIIGHLVRRARDAGLAAVVVTFDPHPAEVVRPGSHPAVLTEAGRKADLIEELGVDVLCVMPFTLPFSRLSPETFVHDVLVEHLHTSAVVVGENFRFGHKAAGDVGLLERLGRTFGFTVEGAPLVASAPASGSRRRTSGPVWTLVTWPRRPAPWAARTGWRASSCAATPGAGSSASRPRTCPTRRTRCRPRGVRGLRGPGSSAPGRVHGGPSAGGGVDRYQSDVRRARAAGGGVRPRLRRRSVRRAARARLRDPDPRAAVQGIEPLVAQIRQDVADTRAALDSDG